MPICESESKRERDSILLSLLAVFIFKIKDCFCIIFFPGPREVAVVSSVEHSRTEAGAEREADQEDRLEDPQGGMARPLHQQGVHAEEALLETRYKVRHSFPGTEMY